MKRTHQRSKSQGKQDSHYQSTVFKDPLPQFAEKDLTYPDEEEPKVAAYRTAHQITVQGFRTNWRPILEFSTQYFPKTLLSVTSQFKTPTPIQAQCWPILLSGANAVGIAQTGSGKTLAYGLPGILHILKTTLPEEDFGQPRMLILAPTRELATQIEEVLTAAAAGTGKKVVCMYGGTSRHVMLSATRYGAHIVVATPGRLLDYLDAGEMDLTNVDYVVLDEADRMLDMGFEPHIRKVFGYLTKKYKQIAMFSATWPANIKRLSHQFIGDPIHVTIGSTSGKLVANENVTQIVEVIEDNSRDTRLISLLQKYHSGQNRIIIFVLYKNEAKRLESWLWDEGYNCVALHSDKKQNFRFEALSAFRSGETPLLIATDVASRGLDIPQVEYVINYSFPLTVEDYVHRIGRTGRAGNTGTAHTFFSAYSNKHLAGSLVNVLRRANQKIPKTLLQFDQTTRKVQPSLGKINTRETSGKHVAFDSSEDE